MTLRLAVPVAVLVFATLTGAPLVAQEQAPRGDITNITVWRVTPTPGVREIWDAVVVCAGEVQGGGLYEQIVWVVGNLTERDPDHLLRGAWLAPDTIALDTAVLNYPTDVRVPVIAHEMLHHRLQRPAGERPGHPAVPFYQPCQLMPEQFLSSDPDYVSPWRGWGKGK